ncbi:YqaA family protein [Jhaorihella thermophila]|uniref:Membrane protein YqaA, SNARE-associated domain n=1 Tax=Jhaorihella thermophila TaxID=488547 RepID=A0A1H5T7U4_9RHOB|nr:YqaA family protein [Jhaorihella thermophila]SEF58866.1 membrane protein YqaA, SNARE-associated domain [Jhaorihella thermophila]
MTTLTALAVTAFLAATILPFSSEALLAAALAAGDTDPHLAIAVAAMANTAGAVLNWWLGRYLLHWQDRRWFPFSPDQLSRASDRFNRYGTWSLLLSWVPLIGDPLTFAAGTLRVPLTLFFPLVAIGKTARYAAIGLLF